MLSTTSSQVYAFLYIESPLKPYLTYPRHALLLSSRREQTIHRVSSHHVLNILNPHFNPSGQQLPPIRTAQSIQRLPRQHPHRLPCSTPLKPRFQIVSQQPAAEKPRDRLAALDYTKPLGHVVWGVAFCTERYPGFVNCCGIKDGNGTT